MAWDSCAFRRLRRRAYHAHSGGFRAKLGVRLENISSVLLLPVFFASSGLRTEIGLLHTRVDWLICLLVIALATIGKLGGSSLAARLTGMGWRESLQLGALMNTRGLMELIALNLGYELHILSQRVFSMLVIMALVTTIMTGPLLTLSAAGGSLFRLSRLRDGASLFYPL